ncbi:glutamine synthetase family protein [Pseudonocardia sp. NPDC046786]|uniref:glutamine synthetase family protein n=1 Tax=Pseudonocardia sp. NPDC046786 TaxID=3155471 RepID=UPI0033CBEA23
MSTGDTSDTAGPDTAGFEARARALADLGVVGVTIGWPDNNGVLRSRTVPVEALPDAATRGIGVTTLFAVFDTRDGIVFGPPGLETPAGDVRLVPAAGPEGVVPLAGRPGLAWSPGRVVTADGGPWPYDQRGVLERQVAAAGEAGLSVLAGYEIEFALYRDDDHEPPVPAVTGPAYGPDVLIGLDGFVTRLLADLRDNGVPVGQLHAEYGPAQLELSIGAADPLTAADRQLLARQTIHAAALAHGYRASFAPLPSTGSAGNGWHLHTSVARDGVNLLSGGDGPAGSTADGAAWLAGLLRDIHAVAAVTAPGVTSVLRRRPGHFAAAYGFWGIENREAALRMVPATGLLGAGHANVELKASDAAANPYLALAVVIGAGLAGIADRPELPDPIQEDPGTWTAEQRAARGVTALPTTPAAQAEALRANPRISAVLGEHVGAAFRAVRASDAAFADGRSVEDVLAAFRYRY